MGLMDKFKNLFTEEVEEEVEEPIKKEVMQVEIPSPARRSEETEILGTPSVPVETMTTETPKKEEYKFPFFDDEDFNTIESSETKKSPRKKSSYRKEPKEVYSPPRDEKKVFKPTPIISPVYGILDQNYQKDDIKKKNERPRFYYDPKEATVDEIRNKAYGTLEDDIETTLFGHDRALFEDEKEEQPKDLNEVKAVDDSVYVTDDEDLNVDLLGDKPRHSNEEEPTITDLLEEELGKDTAKIEENKESPRKISDEELFDMIDSMYQKGDK